MIKVALLLPIFIILTACNKEDTVNPNFIGKWEAEYFISSNSDTIFYKEGTNFRCAYLLIPVEYSSGFELTDATNGELIWCGNNKGQFLTWSFENNIIGINFQNKEFKFLVENLTDNSMQITLDGEKYQMKKI